MIEQYYRDAVCQIRCGDEQGTGFLVSEGLILTARHCVADALSGEEIAVTFPSDAEPLQLVAKVVDDSEEFDVCLLSLETATTRPNVKLSYDVCREGLQWETYGYPVQRGGIGHVLTGTIAQVHATPKLRSDLDLVVQADRQMQNYEGTSGAPLMLAGECLGVVRLSLDGSIAAISTSQIKEFLLRNSLLGGTVNEGASLSPALLRQAPRVEFTEIFEERLKKASGAYVFLEGAHGIGKTTFCRSFESDVQDLEVLGVYSFGESVYGSAHRVQPETFVDWLATQISREMTSRAAAKQSFTSYADVIEHTVKLFDHYANHCVSRGKQGVVFIDGLNEANVLSPDLFTQFLGLLPLKLPEGITVVLSAPNYDQLAVHLGQRIASANRLALPLLNDEVVRRYCVSELSPDLATPTFVASICRKAKGHPLYLRYLIEYANDNHSEAELDDFPEYSGSIEAYYEVIWSQLSIDPNVVQLLAILCRLRWGVPLSDLPDALTDSEKSVFLATLPRVRHLLKSKTESTIYHSSFAEFLSAHTAEMAHQIHARLAKYCESFSERDYCAINSVFHYLRAGDEYGLRATTCCSQEWVDRCVTLGFDVDSLLFDIENGLNAAVTVSTMPEIVRLLLLLQRLGFRYNTLFAQSASLISEALIALKKPKVALLHAIRFRTLIIPLDESLRISYNLLQAGNVDEALELLGMVRDALFAAIEREDNTIPDYIEQSCLLFRCLYFMYLADASDIRMQQMQKLFYRVIKTVEASLDGAPAEVLEHELLKVQGVFLALPIFFDDHFVSLVAIYGHFPKLPRNIASVWMHVIFNCDDWVREFSVNAPNSALANIFIEMEAQLPVSDPIDSVLIPDLLDTLIRFNAPTSLTSAVARSLGELNPASIVITEEDRVEIDYQAWHQGSQIWRLSSYVEMSQCPNVSPADVSTWRTTISELSAAISWCEGAARRANSEGDQALREAVLQQLSTTIIDRLSFSLAQRVSWKDGYAIPESLIPYVYGRMARLYLACFPEHSMELITSIKNRFQDQCGLYSEGFRLLLAQVIVPYVEQSLSDEASDKIFELLDLWRNYLLSNVENRYELVPELLSIIPLLTAVDADEMGQTVFQNMLDVSMGPGWYKEDQIGIVNTALASIPSDTQVSALLPRVAGLLDAASGEMTFQRYVRVEKSRFIGELWRRGLFSQAIEYYKRQLCGTPSELFEDATYGAIDRPEPLKGMRFPGCAIDEQDAVCHIVGNSESVDWRLRWAVLDTYLYGDDRHARRYARLYAQFFNAHANDETCLSTMMDRFVATVSSELGDRQKRDFAIKFFEALSPNLHQRFANTTLYSELPKEQSLPTGSDAKSTPKENRDDVLFQPGLFGRPSAIDAADSLVAGLERHARRGNYADAKKAAVELLAVVQRGGWNIWANDSGSVQRAKEVLLQNESSADVVARRYGSLITSELHVAKWRTAEFLIKSFTKLLSQSDQLVLASIVIDHVQRMVGKADAQTEKFKSIGNVQPSQAVGELLKLLIWTIDHPRWLRRDTAAETLLWLIREDVVALGDCLDEALESQPFNGAEAFFGILDTMSGADPILTWKKLAATGCVIELGKRCNHMSRIVVLHRIASRAAKAGEAEAIKVIAELAIQLKGADDVQSDASDWPPVWAKKLQWEKIGKLMPISGAFKTVFNEEMRNICHPHSVETVWELEQLVATGFREMFGTLDDRWNSRVKFALNRAILKCGTDHPEEIEFELRAYNPSQLWLTNTAKVSSLGRQLLKEQLSSVRRKKIIGEGELIRIHHIEMFEIEDEFRELEINTVLTSEYNGYMPIPPSAEAKFSTVELPAQKARLDSNNTCYFVDPKSAFFGIFTPAIPTASFKNAVGAKDNDFKRTNWKVGRSDHCKGPGRPHTQGASLSIRRGALNLRPGYRLAWIVSIDDQIVDAFGWPERGSR